VIRVLVFPDEFYYIHILRNTDRGCEYNHDI
jgi:hypothetical protein